LLSAVAGAAAAAGAAFFFDAEEEDPFLLPLEPAEDLSPPPLEPATELGVGLDPPPPPLLAALLLPLVAALLLALDRIEAAPALVPSLVARSKFLPSCTCKVISNVSIGVD
jgi:hypothetical protein